MPIITLKPKDIPTTRDRRAIEDVFIKAARLKTLATGLVYFMTEVFRELPGEDPEVAKLVRWASDLASDTLRTGVDIVADL